MLQWSLVDGEYVLQDIREGSRLATVRAHGQKVIATFSNETKIFEVPHPKTMPYYLGKARVWAQQLAAKSLEVRWPEYLFPIGFNPTPDERWECSFDHDDRSQEVYEAISEFDFCHNNDHMDWSSGGDGDNGEALMFLLDMFFHSR